MKRIVVRVLVTLLMVSGSVFANAEEINPTYDATFETNINLEEGGGYCYPKFNTTCSTHKTEAECLSCGCWWIKL
jgi:hypothetical protein